jgi:nucleotide-binding universal stress UspA family protein
MRLVVGVDLRHRSDGAIRFAAWLRSRTADPHATTIVGVHVVESAQMVALRRFDPRPRVIQRLRDEAAHVIQAAVGAGVVNNIDVLEGSKTSRSLESAATYHHADALIVGRKAGVDEQAIVRLGSVARSLLRALPVPTFVVAPDLDLEAIGAGPIVVAVTPGEPALSACAFAVALGQRLGRDVLAVRVVTVPEDYSHIYWSGEDLAAYRAEYLERARKVLAEWLAANGLTDLQQQLRLGGEIHELAAAAREHDAPLIVCGSRLLGPLERMLTPSTSSELAAYAPCAVAVVPPDYRPNPGD